MKYSEIVKAPKLVVRKRTAIAMLEHAERALICMVGRIVSKGARHSN